MTSIASGAFEYCKSVKNVSLPQSVIRIGDGAFSGCDQMTGTIKVPERGKIGEGAFYNCSALMGISVGKGASIGAWAFNDCTSLASANLGEGVSIGEEAFHGCSSLTSLSLKKDTIVGDEAFMGCLSLISANLADNVSFVGGSEHFYSLPELKSVIVGKNCTISESSFYNCPKLSKVVIGDGTVIGEDAFRRGESISSLTIGNSVKIGESAFFGCSNFKKLSLGTKTMVGDQAFCDCRRLTCLSIGTGSKIGHYAFSGCDWLKEVSLGAGTEVGKSAFFDCGTLRKLTVYGKLKIAANTMPFYNCKSLSVIYYGTKKEWEAIAKLDDALKSAKVTYLKNNAVKSVKINGSSAVGKGKTTIFTAVITPANATNKAVAWKSNNPSVATVTSNGVVKGLDFGSAVITVTSKDGNKTAKRTVKVVKPIAVKGVRMNKQTASVARGKTVSLKASVTPSNATDKTVTWKTSNKKVATVTSAGKVKGIREGRVTITATSNDGKKKTTCRVTVK